MGIFFTIFYQPISNLLFFLMNIINTESLVLGVLLLMLVVKGFFLLPSIKNAHIQSKMKNISEEIKTIRLKTKDKQKIAEKTLAVYKRENINPFFTILFLLIQIPVFISIFFVLRDVGVKDFIPSDILYSFVYFPEFLNTSFIFFDLFENGGVFLGLVVVISQAVFLWLAQKGIETADNTKKFQKIIFIVLIVVSFFAPIFLVATVGIYWFFNNLISALQEILFLKKIRTRN